MTVIHTCQSCQVEHREGVAVCWICGGPVSSTADVAEFCRAKLWEISSMVATAGDSDSDKVGI